MNKRPYPYWNVEPPPHVGAQVDQISAHTAEMAAALLDSYMKFCIAVDEDDPAGGHQMYWVFAGTIHKLATTPAYDWVPLIGQLCDAITRLALRHHGGWDGLIQAAMRGDLIYEATGEGDGAAGDKSE